MANSSYLINHYYYYYYYYYYYFRKATRASFHSCLVRNSTRSTVLPKGQEKLKLIDLRKSVWDQWRSKEDYLGYSRLTDSEFAVYRGFKTSHKINKIATSDQSLLVYVSLTLKVNKLWQLKNRNCSTLLCPANTWRPKLLLMTNLHSSYLCSEMDGKWNTVWCRLLVVNIFSAEFLLCGDMLINFNLFADHETWLTENIFSLTTDRQTVLKD